MAYTDFSNWLDDAPAVLRVCRSTDDGRSWSKPSLLVEQEGLKNVATVSFVRLAPREILLFYQTQHSAEDCLLTFRRSTDNGRTFGPPSYCAPGRRHRNCVPRV